MQLLREGYVERRAEEVAFRNQLLKEQKERIDRARKVVVDALVDAGESEKFGEAVAALVERRGTLLKLVDKTESVDAAALAPFLQEVKLSWFERKIMNWLPAWKLSPLQKKEVIQKLVHRFSAADLHDVVDKLYVQSPMHIWQEALASAMESSELFTCPICMDPLVELKADGLVNTSNVWFAPLEKNEHWSSQPCGHACCRTCMSMWAETAINDQKMSIRCPAPGCSYCLFDHDVKALVSDTAFERHQEHKNADYLKHLRSALKEDVRLKTWLRSHARPCPDCHVIVSRSEGCDVMQCVCGTHFCYACGFAKCKCNLNQSKRKDIWRPKAVHTHAGSP